MTKTPLDKRYMPVAMNPFLTTMFPQNTTCIVELTLLLQLKSMFLWCSQYMYRLMLLLGQMTKNQIDSLHMMKA